MPAYKMDAYRDKTVPQRTCTNCHEKQTRSRTMLCRACQREEIGVPCKLCGETIMMQRGWAYSLRQAICGPCKAPLIAHVMQPDPGHVYRRELAARQYRAEKELRERQEAIPNNKENRRMNNSSVTNIGVMQPVHKSNGDWLQAITDASDSFENKFGISPNQLRLPYDCPPDLRAQLMQAFDESEDSVHLSDKFCQPQHVWVGVGASKLEPEPDEEEDALAEDNTVAVGIANEWLAELEEEAEPEQQVSSLLQMVAHRMGLG